MKTLRLYPTNINRPYLDEITTLLGRGGLVICPTDTLYAVCCDALDNRAAERLCRLKGLRPDKNRLSVICSDISQASGYARIGNSAFAVLRSCLPGPYTFVLPATTALPKIFRGRRTVGVRVPDNAIARTIAHSLGHPLLATSIDTAGLECEDIVQPDSIAMRYTRAVDLMVDGGLGESQPSTVVDLTGDEPEVIRMGKGEWSM